MFVWLFAQTLIMKTSQITGATNAQTNALLAIILSCVQHATTISFCTVGLVFRRARLSRWLLTRILTGNAEQVTNAHRGILRWTQQNRALMFALKVITRTTWSKLVTRAREDAAPVPTLLTASSATTMWPSGTSSNVTLIVLHLENITLTQAVLPSAQQELSWTWPIARPAVKSVEHAQYSQKTASPAPVDCIYQTTCAWKHVPSIQRLWMKMAPWPARVAISSTAPLSHWLTKCHSTWIISSSSSSSSSVNQSISKAKSLKSFPSKRKPGEDSECSKPLSSTWITLSSTTETEPTSSSSTITIQVKETINSNSKSWAHNLSSLLQASFLQPPGPPSKLTPPLLTPSRITTRASLFSTHS